MKSNIKRLSLCLSALMLLILASPLCAGAFSADHGDQP